MKKKVVFIYESPHYLHADWAKSINACFVHYINGYKGNLIFSQILALFNYSIPDADIYLVESIKCLLPAIKKKILSPRIKIIVINSDTFWYDYPKYNIIKKELCNIYLSFVDKFISTSEYVKGLAEKYTNIPHSICYPFVNYEKWSKVKVDLKDKNISTIANYCTFRGSDLLLKVFLKLEKQDKNLHLTIIGRKAEYIPDELYKHIPHYIKPGPLEIDYWLNEDYYIGQEYWKHVNITGRVDNPENYLTGTYINTARHDSFGINILEAMAAGVPPIVSECCGAKELLPKELICKCNVNDIIKKYKWLNSDIERKTRLGKACKMIAQSFTKERSIRMFKEAIQ